MTTAIDIPPEITEAIVDAIDDHDISSLKACALINRDFLHASQRRLFGSVTLEFGGPGTNKSARYDRFQSALLLSPKLALYIREFDICGSLNEHIFVEFDVLPTIIFMLQNITTLSIQFDRIHNWQGFKPDLKKALVSIFLLPSIEKLTLNGLCCIPIPLAKCFAHIPYVALAEKDFFFQGYGGDEMTTVPQRLLSIPNTRYLKSLIIQDVTSGESLQPLLDEIYPPICMLEKLSVFCSQSNLDAIAITNALIAKSKNTLTTLELLPIEDQDAHLMNISNLKHLRSIRLFADVTAPEPLKAIRTILSRAPNNNKIEEISIQLVYSTLFHKISKVTTRDDSLDTMLMGPLFSELRGVFLWVMGMGMSSWRAGSERGLRKEDFEGCLPKTYGSGRLHIEIEYFGSLRA
ncbi:hypothetical protein BDQ17DRAFT_1538479 [Cyathus striatus]|nr:hypothetical protein BDQ17DRAFT_1538479 [Cyathus striatus]